MEKKEVKIFLSWSGDISREIARVFNKRIPYILNSARPFFSEEDMVGGMWAKKIASELESSQLGLLFLTKENRNSLWLSFEAGALSKNFDRSKVVPIVFGIKSTDIVGPLATLQIIDFTEDKILQVVQMINEALGKEAFDKTKLISSFKDGWWDSLNAEVKSVLSNEKKAVVRTDTELLEEILKLSRATIAAVFETGTGESLERAFREMSVHEQIFMFLDGIARQRMWTFYPPREGETELGLSLGQMVSNLIKDEKGQLLTNRIYEWLHSGNNHLMFFASEIIGCFTSQFEEFQTPLNEIFRDLDRSKPWTHSQLNCLWAYSRLTSYDEMNRFLLETSDEENQKWVLVAYEQMVKVEEPDKKADPADFIPAIRAFIKRNPSEFAKQKAAKLLEEFIHSYATTDK